MWFFSLFLNIICLLKHSLFLISFGVNFKGQCLSWRSFLLQGAANSFFPVRKVQTPKVFFLIYSIKNRSGRKVLDVLHHFWCWNLSSCSIRWDIPSWLWHTCVPLHGEVWWLHHSLEYFSNKVFNLLPVKYWTSYIVHQDSLKMLCSYTSP